MITILACALQPSRTVRRVLLFTLLFVDAGGIGSMVAARLLLGARWALAEWVGALRAMNFAIAGLDMANR